MVRQIHAVVDGGRLLPTEPLDLPEGREVELVVRLVPTPEEAAERARRFEESLRRVQEAAAQYRDDWWDQLEEEFSSGRTAPGVKRGCI
jgi:predicted DNA-binding antitoxin AbrB/MazE fold protein